MAQSIFQSGEKCWKKAGSMGLATAFSFCPGTKLEPGGSES